MSRLVSCDRSFTCEGRGTSYIGCCHVGGWAKSPKRLGSRDVFWIHLWRSIFHEWMCHEWVFKHSPLPRDTPKVTCDDFTCALGKGSWILITVVSSQHVWSSWIFDQRTQLWQSHSFRFRFWFCCAIIWLNHKISQCSSFIILHSEIDFKTLQSRAPFDDDRNSSKQQQAARPSVSVLHP